MNNETPLSGFKASGTRAVHTIHLPAEMTNHVKLHFKTESLPEKLLTARTMTLNTVQYRIDCVLVIDCIDGLDIPIFAKVANFLKVSGRWVMCCKMLLIASFNEHYHAYEVKESPDWCIADMDPYKTYQMLDIRVGRF